MKAKTPSLPKTTGLRRFRLEPGVGKPQIGRGGYLQRAIERLSYRPYITTRELPLVGTVVPITRCPPDLSGLWGYFRAAGAGGAAT